MFHDRIIAGGGDRTIFDIEFADEYLPIGKQEIIKASLVQI
jgi:hypothetical protein